MSKWYISRKELIRLPICLLFLGTLFCGSLFDISVAQAALFPENKPAQYSGTLPGPTPPIAPTAPSKPLLNEKQENKVVPKEPQPQKKPAPLAKPPEKTPERTVEKALPATEKNLPDSSIVEKGEIGESKEKYSSPAVNEKKAAEAEKNDALPSLRTMAYFILFLLVGASVLYAYFQQTTQNQLPKPRKKTRPPTRQVPQSKELEAASPIRNKSLLEQLIKYDMETYGELRPTLNYDHPFYVEQLIIKYGQGNKETIHRAIQLYHQRRSPK